MARNTGTSVDHTDHDIRVLVMLGLFGVALIHLLDMPDHFPDMAYIGVLYMVLIAACIVVIAGMMHDHRPGWLAAAAVISGLTLLAFVVSRTIGLPNAEDDIGNWDEPLAIASVFIEALVVVVGAYGFVRALSRGEGDTGRVDLRADDAARDDAPVLIGTPLAPAD